MANQSSKDGPDAMNRGLARLASFMRVRGEVERATKRVALLGRPLTAYPASVQWEGVLSPTQTGGVLGGWSKKLKAFEAALLSQHLDFATVAKDLAVTVGLVAGAGTLFASLDAIAKAAEARKLANLEALVEPFAKLAGIPLDWAAGPILRAGRAAARAGAAILRGVRAIAEVSPMGLTPRQVVVPAAAGVLLGEGIYPFGIKGSRLEGWLASHLHDERSDVHLRKWEARRGGTNTWNVTHAPQITVVVNGAEAAHPRKIAEQMVMALQAHHSELDQKLADVWRRQAVREERTGF